jgi:hypothetical protein
MAKIPVPGINIICISDRNTTPRQQILDGVDDFKYQLSWGQNVLKVLYDR